VEALRTMRSTGATRVEVRREAHHDFLDEMERRSEDTVWLKGGCTSYYTTANGQNAGLYPGWSFEYRRRTSRFDADNYEMSA
jgi:hypothetical protein